MPDPGPAAARDTVQESPVQDSSAQDSSAQDGSMHDGPVHNDSVHNGPVQEGTVRPIAVQPVALQPIALQPNVMQTSARPLRAAEITAIGAGRRLYRADTIGTDTTVNTILRHTDALESSELDALQQIGERSFGICARAGVHYQQAADLLSELR